MARDSSATTNGGNGSLANGNGLPAWVRAVGFIGIPGAIALFLVYTTTAEVPALTREVHTNSARLQVVQQQHAEMNDKLDSLYRMLQRICSNTASTAEERTRCFDR
jgi:hypothetical protein